VDPLSEIADTLVAALRDQLPPTVILAGVEVELGALVELAAADLHAALTARLPGVEVRIREVPAVVRCDDCGAEYPADEHPCPACGSPRATVVHGHELGIVRAWGSPTAA